MPKSLAWMGTWCAVGLLALATSACSDAASTGTPGQGDNVPVGGQVEIFSWWTRGNESQALETVLDLYRTQYPNTTVVNATLRSGDQTRTELVRRLSGNDPPDSFQILVGKDVRGWVRFNGRDDSQSKLERLDDLYASEGWTPVFSERLRLLASVDGHVYAVPVNLQRENNLYYNLRVFASNTLSPPTTLEEFYAVAEVLKSKGIKPLALGAKAGSDWVVRILFQTVFAATVGPQYYDDFWAGRRSADDPELKAALDAMLKVLSYTGDDSDTLDWDTAARQVGEGKAAMTIHGDWVLGYLTTDMKLQPDVDFAEAPAPGTHGLFIGSADAFCLPLGTTPAGRANAVGLLKVFGSKAGQDAFNPKKGSIPARLDADLALYDATQRRRIEQSKTDTFLGGFELVNGTTPMPIDTILGDMRRIYLRDGAEAAVKSTIDAIRINYSKLGK